MVMGEGRRGLLREEHVPAGTAEPHEHVAVGAAERVGDLRIELPAATLHDYEAASAPCKR